MNLTADKRKAMPQSQFALPGKRFPMNDATHQRLAISGATRAEHAGNISAGTASKIKSEARSKLGNAAKPHMHALSMGAATHLEKMGHISPAQSAQIQAKSRAGMNAAKQPVQPPMAFGSLAPRP